MKSFFNCALNAMPSVIFIWQVIKQDLQEWAGSSVTRLGDFSPIRLLFVGSLKK
jgi:hypothetical protein